MRTWVPAVILPLGVLALTHNPVVIGIGVALAGFAAGPVFVSSETAVQEEAPIRRQATALAQSPRVLPHDTHEDPADSASLSPPRMAGPRAL